MDRIGNEGNGKARLLLYINRRIDIDLERTGMERKGRKW